MSAATEIDESRFVYLGTKHGQEQLQAKQRIMGIPLRKMDFLRPIREASIVHEMCRGGVMIAIKVQKSAATLRQRKKVEDGGHEGD